MSTQSDLQDLADYITSLPPDQQAEAMSNLNLMNANQVPYSFQGAYQPELDASNLESAQYGGSYNIPQLTTKGKVDPRDLTQVGQSVTLAKNREGLLADKVLQMQAGPGAYGAGAFDPTVTYKGNTVDFPGERALQAYAGTKGWQGFMAKRMLGQTSTGVRESPSEAWANLQAYIDSPSKTDAETKDKDALKASLVPSNAGSGDPVQAAAAAALGVTSNSASPYNIAAMQSWANDRYADLIKDRPRESLFQDPKTGAYYDQAPETTPSAQAKWFQDQGLDLPTDSYADPVYQERILNAADPNRLVNNQQAMQDYGMSGAVTQAANKGAAGLGSAYEDMLRQMREEGTQRAAYITGNQAAVAQGDPNAWWKQGQPDQLAAAMPPAQPMSPNPAQLFGRMTPDQAAAALAQMQQATGGSNIGAGYTQPGVVSSPSFINRQPQGGIMFNSRVGNVPRPMPGVPTPTFNTGAPPAALPTQVPETQMVRQSIDAPGFHHDPVTGLVSNGWRLVDVPTQVPSTKTTAETMARTPPPVPAQLPSAGQSFGPQAQVPSADQLGSAWDKEFAGYSQLTPGGAAPVFDFGGSQQSNAKMQDVINQLTKAGGRTGTAKFSFQGRQGEAQPGSRVVRNTQSNADALGKAYNAARKQATAAYGNQFTQGMATGGGQSATYLDDYRKELAMRSLAQQGRTPLNDEIMQRRLLLNSLGLYS